MKTPLEQNLEDSKPLVMIVDDYPMNLKKVQHHLHKDCETLLAENGVEALNLIYVKKKTPDLILLDIEMPDIDGYEVCRRLKSDPQTHSIPIIFVTARDELKDELVGFKLGAVDYITKPVRREILRARVRLHIALKRQRDCLVDLTQSLKVMNAQLKAEVIVRKRVEKELEAQYRHEEQRLKKTIRKQQMALDIIEKQMPGISKLKKDEKGVILLEDVDDLDDLGDIGDLS